MEIYAFSNGVVLRRVDLLEEQIERYAESGNPNLHEPIEEEHLLQLFQDDKGPEPVFLDVGAAVGYYTILVRKLYPQARVFAIEPLPVHRDAFQVNLALNGLSHEGVNLLDCAIAASDGIAWLQNLRFGDLPLNFHPAAIRASAVSVTP